MPQFRSLRGLRVRRTIGTVSADDYVEFEEAVELGAGWAAVGFWCRPGPLVLVRIRGPLDGPPRFVTADLDVAKATFIDAVPFAASGEVVQRLVIGISCELSSSTLLFVE